MKYIKIKKLNKINIKSKYLIVLKSSMVLSQKEKQYRDNIRKRKGKSIYQKFFIGLIIGEGVNIYNHRKTSMRNIIINQILKNEEMDNDTKEMNNMNDINQVIIKNKNDINNKLATLILFKLILFIIYRKLFNHIKIIVLSEKYKLIIMKRYLKQLNKAYNNINAIRLKMDKIKSDVLNLNEINND